MGCIKGIKSKVNNGVWSRVKPVQKIKRKKNGLIVSFTGRLIKDKGVSDFINAAKIVHKWNPKVEFWLIGDIDRGNYSSLTEEDLNALRLEKTVKVLGYRTDIPDLLSRSNIICLPSYREGFPKSLIEAAAAQRATITTDVPGCKDAIIPNVTGIVVPVRNPQIIASSIRYLLENNGKRMNMGKEGRKLAERKFSVCRVVKEHFTLYELLLNAIDC